MEKGKPASGGLLHGSPWNRFETLRLILSVNLYCHPYNTTFGLTTLA